VEMVSLSLTAEGMVLLMIPCLMAEVDMRADLLWVVLECICRHVGDVHLWLCVLVGHQCLLAAGITVVQRKSKVDTPCDV
jgi:hypothetical protein